MSTNVLLHDAIAHGAKNDVFKYVSEGARLNTYNGDGHSPLYTAIIHDQPQLVRYLIKNGCKMDQICRDSKRSALSVACASEKQNIVKFLLKNQHSGILSIDIFNNTALDIALDKRNVEITALLLEARCPSASVYRHYVSLFEEESVELLLLLFAYDDCSIYSSDKLADIQYNAVKSGNMELFPVIWRWLKSTECKGINQDARIMLAGIKTKHRDVVRKLCSRKFVITDACIELLCQPEYLHLFDIVYPHLSTPSLAYSIGKYISVEQFTKFRDFSEFFHEDDISNDLLQHVLKGSISNNNIPFYTYLIEKGDNLVRFFPKYLVKAFCLAGNVSFPAEIPLKEDHINAMYAKTHGIYPYKAIISESITKPKDIHDSEIHAGSCAMWAVQSGDVEMQKYVLEYGMSVDSPLSYPSAQYEAVQLNDMNMLKVCLQHKCFVNKPCTYSGSTAFHLACKLDRLDMVKVLLDHGAHVNRLQYTDISPLYIACRYSSLDMVHLLIEKNANLSAHFDTVFDFPQGILVDCYRFNREVFDALMVEYKDKLPTQWGYDLFLLGCIEKDKRMVTQGIHLTENKVMKYAKNISALCQDQDFFSWVYCYNIKNRGRRSSKLPDNVHKAWQFAQNRMFSWYCGRHETFDYVVLVCGLSRVYACIEAIQAESYTERRDPDTESRVLETVLIMLRVLKLIDKNLCSKLALSDAVLADLNEDQTNCNIDLYSMLLEAKRSPNKRLEEVVRKYKKKSLPWKFGYSGHRLQLEKFRREADLAVPLSIEISLRESHSLFGIDLEMPQDMDIVDFNMPRNVICTIDTLVHAQTILYHAREGMYPAKFMDYIQCGFFRDHMTNMYNQNRSWSTYEPGTTQFVIDTVGLAIPLRELALVHEQGIIEEFTEYNFQGGIDTIYESLLHAIDSNSGISPFELNKFHALYYTE